MPSNNLWAPWRIDYIQKLQTGADAAGCFLCQAATVAAGSDEARQRLVLVRDDRGMILLNRFPYTNGHLLVAVHEHVGDLSDLSAQQRQGLMDLTCLGERLLKTAMNPQGINVGINLGRCAGAGVPGHLHVHLVPRWNGDTNFMQIVGEVRVIPQALEHSFEHFASTLEHL
jgi:ATP adenylyltransferase